MANRERSEGGRRLKRQTLFWILFIGLLFLDQAVKFWARGAVDGREGASILALWPGVFELTLVFNRGIAFGQLQGYGVLLTPIALIIAGGSVWYSVKHPQAPKIYHIVASLFAAGALGNLIDRVYLGKVTDMFDFRLIGFPVFNVADACISVSGAIMVLLWIKEAIDEKRVKAEDGVETDKELEPSPSLNPIPTSLPSQD